MELDALGGAAVVTVPSPLLPPTAAIPAARAAYMMSGRARSSLVLSSFFVLRFGEHAQVAHHFLFRSLSPPTCPTARPPAVTASQVPGSEGALALYLLPRYLLINTLDVPIQYKQQARAGYRWDIAAAGDAVLKEGERS